MAGVCMRRLIDEETGEEGELERVRLKLFDYTSKKVLTIRKFNEKVEKEIRRVKTMKNPKNAWIVKS